jgi:hypothetical protein
MLGALPGSAQQTTPALAAGAGSAVAPSAGAAAPVEGETPAPANDVAATPSAAASAASAADSPATAAKAPVRSARLSFFTGDLRVQRADNTGEDTPALNMPLNEGTRLVTGDYGQAEIEFEDGSVARLTPNTSLTLDSLALDAKSVAHTQLSLLSGLAYFELRHAPGASYRIEAGSVTAEAADNSVLRISLPLATSDEAKAQPEATFAVLSGTVIASRTDGFRTGVKGGESLRADPDDATRYFLNQQVDNETWDAWNQQRDQIATDQASEQTAARNDFAGSQGYGWSDLDANGTWYDVPGLGEVWQPGVASVDAADLGSDFDPYGDGAFVWSSQGYIWASGYTWGWLPFHCGRWDWYPGFGWVWQPNRLCGVWGFGGAGLGGGMLVGAAPPLYHLVKRPPSAFGPSHPIRPIHRPPMPPQPVKDRSTGLKIAGVVPTPLPHVALSAPIAAEGFYGTESSPLGGALYSDFPLESESRHPVLGTVAPHRAPAPPDALTGGWTAHVPSTPGTQSTLKSGSPHGSAGGVPAHLHAGGTAAPAPHPAAAAPAPARAAPAPAPAASAKPK